MGRRSFPVVDEIPLYQGDMDADLKLIAHNHLAETSTCGLPHTNRMTCPAFGISTMRCQARMRDGMLSSL